MLSTLHGLYDDRIYWKESISLKNAGYHVIHISIGSEDKDFISNEGIRLIQIQQKRHLKNPYLDKLYRIISFKKPIHQKVFDKAVDLQADVYHFHDLQLNKIGQKLKNLPFKPKVIYDIHEPYPDMVSTTESSNLIKKVFFKCYGMYIRRWEFNCAARYDAIIATETIVANRFKTKIPSVPVEVIYNYTTLLPNIKNSRPDYDFIYCGGIMERRGVLQVIEAVKLLNEAGLPSRTLFIGPIKGNGLKSKIDQLIHTYKLSETITFHPSVPYAEVAEWYAKARIGFCLFNNTPVNHITMPIKLFEYLVCGLPVICSNFGKMREITEPNNTGIMVNPDNSKEIACAMQELLTNKVKYDTLHANCLKAAPNYLWEIMEKKLVEFYSEVH